MTAEKAQEIALLCLGWLVGNDELLPVFLGASGASLQDLRAGADDPAIHLALLDFIMMDDAWVTACCDAIGEKYDALARARMSLPGGAEISWT